MAEGRKIKEFAKGTAAAGGEVSISTERSAVVLPAPEIPKPPFYGIRVRKDFDLNEVFQYINHTALFKNQWQLKTAAQSDYVRLVEEKYMPVLLELQKEVVANGWFEPKVVYGYFPCQSEGNDVVLYDSPQGRKEIQRFTFPRQREGRKLSIADFFLPIESETGLTARLVGAVTFEAAVREDWANVAVELKFFCRRKWLAG